MRLCEGASSLSHRVSSVKRFDTLANRPAGPEVSRDADDHDRRPAAVSVAGPSAGQVVALDVTARRGTPQVPLALTPSVFFGTAENYHSNLNGDGDRDGAAQHALAAQKSALPGTIAE